MKQYLLCSIFLALASFATAQSTAFTYQGHLMDAGASANGNYDIQFTLKNALTAGGTVGTPQAVSPVTAVNGIFTVTLDFGSTPFDGSDRWVELGVRPAGSVAAYTVLTPRQRLTATPYALRALNATNLTGTITAGNIANGTITGAMISGGAMTNSQISPSAAISATKLASGLVDDTELGHLNGVTQPLQGQLDGKVSKSGDTMTGTLNMNALSDIAFGAGTGFATARLRGPSDLSSSYTLSLPSVAGTNGQLLTTDSFGTLSWVTGATPTGTAGGILSGTYPNPSIAAGSITGAMLANNTITSTQIQNNAIGTAQIVAAAVDGSKIANGAITPGKLDASLSAILARLDSVQTFTAANTFSNAGNSFTGSGGGLTALNAGNVSTGTLNDARLSNNVALRVAANTFTTTQTINSTVDTPLNLASTNIGGTWFNISNTSAGGRTWNLISTGSNNSEGVGKLLLRDGNIGAVRLTVDTNGNAGIGRVPTANRLEIEGDASKSSAGSWLANSDRRIKEDIEPIKDALETLDKVRLVDFRYTDDYRAGHPGIADQRYLNVVAQEFREVFPDHVKSSGEKLPDGSEILQVDTYPLTIYSAAAVQELHRENKELKARIERLEKLIEKGAGK